MKICSLNVNNFGGTKAKPFPYEYIDDHSILTDFRSDPNRISTALDIFQKIQAYHCDIIFLHEFDVNSPAGNRFILEMANIGLYPVYPNGEPQTNFARSFSSISIAFVRDNNITSKSSPVKQAYRWNQLNLAEDIVLGVHVPNDINFWDQIIEYCGNNKNSRLIVIGDFNVTDNPHPDNQKYKDKLDKLLAMGIKDAWLESNSSSNMSTFIGGTRIDYCLLSEQAFNSFSTIQNDRTFIESNLSDHSAIVTEFI